MRPRPLFSLLLLLCAACGGAGPAGLPDEHVHWVDAVQVGGNRYYAVGDGPSPVYTGVGRRVVEADLGPEVARTRFRVEGNVRDSRYVLKEGDAAYLEPGTPIHGMKGYSAGFRLVARTRDGLRLYERAFSDGQRGARTGADLFDLRGKVSRIGVNNPSDGRTEVGAIEDPAAVARLADLVLAAPAGRAEVGAEERRYFIAFHFPDGTASARAYWPRTGELTGVLLPASFATAVEQALRAGGSAARIDHSRNPASRRISRGS